MINYYNLIIFEFSKNLGENNSNYNIPLSHMSLKYRHLKYIVQFLSAEKYLFINELRISKIGYKFCENLIKFLQEIKIG